MHTCLHSKSLPLTLYSPRIIWKIHCKWLLWLERHLTRSATLKHMVHHGICILPTRSSVEPIFPPLNWNTLSYADATPILNTSVISSSERAHEWLFPHYRARFSPTDSATTSLSIAGKVFSGSCRLWRVTPCCRQEVKCWLVSYKVWFNFYFDYMDNRLARDVVNHSWQPFANIGRADPNWDRNAW